MQTSLLRSSTVRQLTFRRFASTTTESASQAASQTASKAQDAAKQTAAKAQDAAKAAASKLLSAASGLGNSLGKIGGRTGQLIKGVECEHWFFHLVYFVFPFSGQVVFREWESESIEQHLPASLGVGYRYMKLD